MNEYLTNFLNSETLRYFSDALPWVNSFMCLAWLAHFYTKALKFNPNGVKALERKITSRLKQLFFPIQNWRFQDYQRLQPSEPPCLPEFLVGLFAKKRYRNSILCDLAESFDRDLSAGMSARRAKRRYWAAALNSIGPQALAAVKRLGVWSLLIEAARRITE